MQLKSTVTKKRSKKIKRQTPPPKRPSWLLWITLLVAMAGTFHEYVIKRDDGSYELSTERQEKLNRELEELEEGVQYALIALTSKEYLCYNCGVEKTIFLNAGEVWKYRYTSKKIRYTDTFLNKMQLKFYPQFESPLVECMKEEKRKTYHYPLLPENLLRSLPLPRPPGNKQDN
ncbi:MAG: hypothetical protein AAGI49_06310 [Bacteroidota bacterium]